MAAGSASGGGSQGIKAGRAYVEIGTQDAGLKAGLAAAKRAVLSLGRNITAAGGIGLGLGTAIVAPILESFREVVKHFDDIGDAASRTGATTEAISDLGYAAKQSGAELGDVENGIKFLDKAMAAAGKGSEEATEALAAFGLTVEDLKGKDAREKFLAISQGLESMEESAQGPALEALLGRGARSLRPMLESSRELARLLKENGEIGGRVSKEDADNADKVDKAFNRLTSSVKNAFLAIGAAILPHAETVDTFSRSLANGITQVKQFIDENRAAVLAVLGIGAGIAAAGAALVGLGLAVTVAGVAFGGLVTLVSAVGSVLAVVFSPAGLIVAAAVVAAIVAIAALLELFPDEFAAAAEAGEKAWGGLKDTFNTTWQGIKDALKAGDLSLALQIAVDGLDVIWKGFLYGLTVAWNSFKDDWVEGWHDALTEIKVAIADASQQMQKQLGTNVKEDNALIRFGRGVVDSITGAGLGPRLGSQIAEAITKTGDEIRADAAGRKTVRLAERAASTAAAAAELAAAQMKLAQDAAEAARKAAGPPKELGPMPREVLRQAAVAGLGAVRGQMGGYGASFALGVSGETIQKQQLTQLEAINENTKEGGGLKGW